MMPGPDSSAGPADGSAPAPAPGPLHLVQSFANTLSADPDMDHLRTREEAAAWLHSAALLPAEAAAQRCSVHVA